jgi:anti-sigma regulatory factor (Ser/Thr protein kinase)
MNDVLPAAVASAVEGLVAESLKRVPEAANLARHLVRGALASWELPGLSDAAGLLVTELVSNAVRHATGDELRVDIARLVRGQVRISVLDQDRTKPTIKPLSLEEESGRGLLLIEAMSAAWGVDLLPGGKRVWAELEPI